MVVNVNNQPQTTEATTLAGLIDQLGLPAAGVAVGVAGRMVPRDTWATFNLTEGMNLIIIKAACGG
ncbi:MAG: sulfur carrier protein ThiS [Alloprevotella sp.]